MQLLQLRGFAMRKTLETNGFTPPTGHALGSERRTAVLAELVATVALVVCTLVAATVVARADIVGSVIDNEGSVFALALLLGLLFIGMGGLTALTLPGHNQQRHKKS